MNPLRNRVLTTAVLVAVVALAVSCGGTGAPPPTVPATRVPAPGVIVKTPIPTSAPQGVTPSATVSPSPTVTQVPARAPSTTPPSVHQGATLTFENERFVPDLDIYDLVRRVKPDADLTPPGPPAPGAVGDRVTFNVLDVDMRRVNQVSAVLMAITEHADFYVQPGLGITRADIDEAARLYEERIYPGVRAGFLPDLPGGDDRRLALLHTALPDALGYYDASNEYPQSVYPASNLRPVLFLNAREVRLGTEQYVSLVAHELQHAFHRKADPHEEPWINEGLSVLAETPFGGGSAIADFAGLCDPTQIMAWPDPSGEAWCNYAGAGLLMEYLATAYPGPDGTLRDLVGRPESGRHGIDAFLKASGYATNARGVLAEWGVANYLDGRTAWNPYPDRVVAARPTDTMRSIGDLESSFVQFAPSYVRLALPDGSYNITFHGARHTPLLPPWKDGENPFWWSGAADSGDASLTRAFDLRGVDGPDAILHLLLWYEIEEDWDFAYVLVSTDGGESWDFVESPGMTAQSDSGIQQALGPGYTGDSRPSWDRAGWTIEQVDLTGYVGHEVLVRLEYVTDQGVNRNGMVMAGSWLPASGHVWISEDGIGLLDGQSLPPGPYELGGGWAPHGFLYSNNLARQEYEIRLLLTTRDGGHEIRAMTLDETAQGAITLNNADGAYRYVAVMVFPMAPATRQPAIATLSVEQLATG